MSLQRPVARSISGGLFALACLSAAAPAASAAPQTVTSAALSDHLQAPAATLEVVVAFKDSGKVKGIVDAFWSQPKVAQARFEAFKHNYPDMVAATLVRATYSGELVLAFPCAEASPERRASFARDLAARLARLPDVSYAEPDLTFLTQKL